jgi:DNA modification methylase
MNYCELGDCREIMRRWAADGVRVQTCVTSPPYWGLRDYGVEGQLGLEKTPDEYVANMVEVFRCVREVLADDGTVWLNLGDSYIGSNVSRRWTSENGMAPKNLVGIPWRVAFALQSDGWYMRSDIIWHKPNPMPESVTDRPTKSHEYLFLLSKSERYYYDAEAIKEPGDAASGERYAYAFGGEKSARLTRENADGPGSRVHPIGYREYDGLRNRRTVWTVATNAYSGAHFATFPRALVEPCILAGSRPGDIVLDPFMGSGTTAMVAQDLGRKWLGCELNPEYIKLQALRTAQAGMEFA